MNRDIPNELIIKRFCGEEVYPLESAAWSIWNSAVLCVEMWFEEGKNLHDDTKALAQAPGWELYFNIPPMDEEDVKPGMVLEEKDNRTDETHFYYCEHLPTRNNRIEVLGRDGDRLLLKITGECCDINFYDGSRGNDILEITAWIDKE